ncbi:DUF4043 family protein, partial [uncultured Maritalea sp.]|uniref:phage capsid family protein n=1 Tax=uncultured Maritalea sp. TaxID=757249 RepID=UPI0026272F45
DLRADATTAGNWFDLQRASIEGGKIKDNGILSGALGVYNRTLLVESTRLPLAINSSTGAAISNTRRAVFCGAQALSCAYGKDSGPTKFVWTEKLFDYDNELGVSVSCIHGMKKSIFNSEDFATITIPTYAAPAA